MLLDWTGRELRADKRGAIPNHLAPIMDRLGLNRSNWVETVPRIRSTLQAGGGATELLVDAAARRSRRWFQGKAAARTDFCRPTARRRAVNRHLHCAFTKEARPPRAQLAVRRRLDRANRSTSHVKRSRIKTTVVSIQSASDRLGDPRADAFLNCSEPRVCGCLDSRVCGCLDSAVWIPSEHPSTPERKTVAQTCG